MYSLPTSGGKTLVAEVLILKELLCKKRDALMILPFVSIVQEKVKGLAQLAVELDFLVEEYAGSRGRFPPIKHRRKCLYIATIEKAHSLVNSLLEQDRLGSLGLLVVDELHMIGEGRSRGACLETTLLKVIHARAPTQIIGMSATLNNISDLLSFLKADIFSSDFRPVKLTEYVKLQDNVFEVQKGQTLQDSLEHQKTVTFEYSPEMAKVDPDHLLGLVTEVIPQHSCLIFCPTKKNCENVALMLSKLMAKHKRELSQVRKQERRDLLKELYRDGDQRMCPVLQHTIHYGLAYHHSGLTTDERQLLEAAYTDGVLCVLACTSTLAAGVNLPAKRVILRNPYIGTQFLNRSQYKQMIGRAGRAGKDTTGESILIVSPKDRCKVWDIISGPVESCFSSLTYDDGKGVKSLILSSIGLQITSTTQAVFNMMSQTLLSIQASNLSCDIVAMTKDALQQLIDEGLVVQKRSLSQGEEIFCHAPSLEVTPLGRATFKGSIDLEFSTQLYTDLKKAEEALVLASHLHLLFLVTPYDLVKDVRPSWMTYFKQISLLTPVELKVAELIGVPEAYVAKKASGQATRQVVNEFVVKRFYLTLMLYDLWRQKSLWEVAEKFDQPRGFIQNLLSGTASFGACVYHFCQELDEFWAYQELLGTFVKRLAYCVSAELLPLMEISGVKLGRARQLYSAGFHSTAQVAAADPETLVRSIKQIPRKVARQIVASAKLLLNEKAEALLQEVEDLVTVPVDRMTSQGSPRSSSQLNDMDIFSQSFSSQ